MTEGSYCRKMIFILKVFVMEKTLMSQNIVFKVMLRIKVLKHNYAENKRFKYLIT